MSFFDTPEPVEPTKGEFDDFFDRPEEYRQNTITKDMKDIPEYEGYTYNREVDLYEPNDHGAEPIQYEMGVPVPGTVDHDKYDYNDMKNRYELKGSIKPIEYDMGVPIPGSVDRDKYKYDELNNRYIPK